MRALFKQHIEHQSMRIGYKRYVCMEPAALTIIEVWFIALNTISLS